MIRDPILLQFGDFFGRMLQIYLHTPYLFQQKIHVYWPSVSQPLKTGHYLIEVTGETTFGEYMLREMKMTNTTVSLLKYHALCFVLCKGTF